VFVGRSGVEWAAWVYVVMGISGVFLRFGYLVFFVYIYGSVFSQSYFSPSHVILAHLVYDRCF